MKNSTKLRQLIAERNTFIKPGIYDSMSAHVMEMCGFKVIGISGAAISTCVLGKPDLGFAALSDMTAACRNISSSVSIPVIADADTGYGNAINVLYTTEEFIKAGAAGFHMEDQEFPKRCGQIGGKKVISTEEMVGKIKAACRVRDELDKDFVIIARSDVRGTAGGTFQMLIDRCLAYIDAGADMIFPEALKSIDEVEEAAARIPVPIHLNRGGGVSVYIPTSRLRELGISIVSQPGDPMLTAAKAMWDWGTNALEHDVDYITSHMASLKGTPFATAWGFANMDKYLEMEKLYLPKEQLDKYEGSLGFMSDTTKS